MKTVVKEWIQIVFGLLVFALGVHLTIFANIGLAPWDCLGMGIAKHTPLNYGLSMTTMAVAILCIDLMLKERIGFGTIIDALLTGNLIQMFNSLNPFPENTSIPLGIVLMLTGLATQNNAAGRGTPFLWAWESACPRYRSESLRSCCGPWSF